MDAIEKLLIEREIERLVTRYCHYVDHDEAAKIADLFTEDGVWEASHASMNGKDQIRKGFLGRQNNRGRVSRHVCNNMLIDIISETEAVGIIYLSLYFFDGEPGRASSPTDCLQKLGEYRDCYRKTEAGWLFSSRKSVTNFLRDPA